jgi:hypothetical protein
MKKKKKPVRKKKEGTRDLVLEYTGVPIPFAQAHEFTFLEKGPMNEQVKIIAVQLPGVATIVVGAEEGGPGGPRICWSYPSGMSMKEAVSKAFLEILEKACAEYVEAKKAGGKK